MDRVENSTDQEGFVQILKDKVENLRRKLLDLTRRNPLISANLGRRGPFARIVDELPDVLMANLSLQKPMRFVPLPSLEDDPKDEQTREFRNALSQARAVGEAYLEQLQNLDPDAAEALDREEQIDRDLKDRVREQLGMLPRAEQGDTSLSQHAKNNHISPSYDLPRPEEEHEDGRHTDEDIQTLLLPDEFERKLNGILAKSRTWIQESGINVLHAAFGFLEWKEPKEDRVYFSPIVLLPVELEKKKTRKGLEFRVNGRGDEAETNLVLAEKLKLDFSVELPVYEGGSVEDYLKRVADAPPSNLNIRVRRQVVFGVFPSSRMAMYHDLDTSSATFEQSDIIKTMLIGTEASSATPFEEEYEVDAPEIEEKVPYVVMDADSSQFSTLVDLAEGRNLAVEGPPGTGKSQTIVNAIACALGSGKKVLFVAEKMAALEIVKSRLESVGLGEFVLPLQAERSTKEKVIQSIRGRVEMEAVSNYRDLESIRENFNKYRAELAEYVSVIGRKFGNSELSVHEILGKNIATHEILDNLPKEIRDIDFDQIEDMSSSQVQNIISAAESLGRAWGKLKDVGDYWRGLSVENISKFDVEKIRETANAAEKSFHSLSVLEQALNDMGMESSQYEQDLDLLKSCLNGVELTGARPDADLVDRLLDQDSVDHIEQFISGCNALRDRIDEIGRSVREPMDAVWNERLAEIERVCQAHDFETLNLKELESRQGADNSKLEDLQDLSTKLRPFLEAFPECRDFLICDLQCAAGIIEKTNGTVLALRNETTASPEAAIVIRQVCELGEKLKRSAVDLGTRVSLKTETDPQHLRKHACQIAEAGMFGFLSPSYRSAKQAYMELAYAARFDRVSAASDLKALSDWLDGKDRFFKLPALDRVLGLHNLGIDTDFVSFGNLLKFFEVVEQRLPGVEKLAIRDVLKHGALDLLVSIPKISLPEWEGDYESLLERIDELTRRKESFESRIQELSTLLSDIPAADRLDIVGLQVLRSDVVRLHEIHAELTDNEPVQALLQDQFSGPDTVANDAEPELSTAKTVLPAVEEWRELIVKLIRDNKVADFRSQLEKYLNLSSMAANQLNALSDLTGQNDAHFRTGRTSAQIADFLKQAVHNSEEMYKRSEYAVALDSFAKRGHPKLANICQENCIPLSDLPKIANALVARSLAKRVYRDFRSVLARIFHE